jgi:uncharacterized membrane protein
MFFDVLLWGKALYGFFEACAGLFLLAVSHASINLFFVNITRGELAEDPHDWLSNSLLNASGSFTHHAQLVVALYLIAYGVTKMVLAYDLLNDRIRVYPYAMAFFLVGLLYQAYKLVVAFSPLLLAGTAIEALTLVIIAVHYNRLKCR